jgi:hypothetical protein
MNGSSCGLFTKLSLSSSMMVFPEHISFDHDLGDGVPTGFDFVKWLVESHLDGRYLFPDNFSYAVHSANPPGAANIKGTLDSFLSHIKGREATA